MQVHPQRPRVLVIDDEHTVADSLTMILNMSGFQATVGYSGEQALELARTQQFDVVISDVVMLGINGIEAAMTISELQPECRILLVSGHTETADMLKSAHEKGHDFEIVAKPFHPLFLLELLRNSPRPFIAP